MRTFSYRVYPNANQLRELERTLETHRRLYNQILDAKQLMWSTERCNWGLFEQMAWFSRIRTSHRFYSQINSHSARQTMRRLDRAFSLFFKKNKAGYPRFKTADSFNSFEYTNGWKLIGNKLRLQYVGSFYLNQKPVIRMTLRWMEAAGKLDGDNARLREQVAELERELNRRKVEQLKKPTVTDVLSVCEELTAENAELRRLTDRHDRDYAEVQKQVDSLRELLRECRRHIYADCLGKELVARIDAELLK